MATRQPRPTSRKHQDFTAKVGEFKQGFGEGRLGLSVSVMNFLSDWLRSHIKGKRHAVQTLFETPKVSSKKTGFFLALLVGRGEEDP